MSDSEDSLLSSGEEDEDDDDFSQRLPPVYKALRRILVSYPKGQIFKVSYRQLSVSYRQLSVF